MTHKSIDALLASTMFLLFTMVTPHYEDIAKKIGFVDSAYAIANTTPYSSTPSASNSSTNMTVTNTATSTTATTFNFMTTLSATTPVSHPVSGDSRNVELGHFLVINSGPDMQINSMAFTVLGTAPANSLMNINLYDVNGTRIAEQTTDNGSTFYFKYLPIVKSGKDLKVIVKADISSSITSADNGKTIGVAFAAGKATNTSDNTVVDMGKAVNANLMTLSTAKIGDPVAVSLSYDSSPSRIIFTGSKNEDLAQFTLSNNSGSDVKINNIYFKRIGISSDKTLAGVNLYVNNVKIASNLTITNGQIYFKDVDYVISKGVSVKFLVKADIATNTSGQTIGVQFGGFTATGMASGNSFSGTSNVSGNIISILDYPNNGCTSTTAPWIKVLSPNGGESYKAGDKVTVKWESCNLPSSDVGISLQGDWGNNFWLIQSAQNSGSSLVTLPTTVNFTDMQYGKHFKIIVRDWGTTTTVDTSDNLFEINNINNTSCTNWKVTSGGPQGGTYWENLKDFSKHPEIDQYRIQWFNGNWSNWYTSGLDDADSKKNDNGSSRYIIAYKQDHKWETRDCVDGQTQNNSSITLLTPNGGENFPVGGKMAVYWKTSSDISINNQVYLEFSKNKVDDNTVFNIALGVNDGNENVYIPKTTNDGVTLVTGGLYHVRVVTAANSAISVYDYADQQVGIKSDATNSGIQVVSPNGGEVYVASSNSLDYFKPKFIIYSEKQGLFSLSVVKNNSKTDPQKLFSLGEYSATAQNGRVMELGRYYEEMRKNPGNYYLMAEWKSKDGSEDFVDFSDATFSITENSSSGPSCGKTVSNTKDLPYNSMGVSFQFFPDSSVDTAEIGTKDVSIGDGFYVNGKGCLTELSLDFYSGWEGTVLGGPVYLINSDGAILSKTTLNNYSQATFKDINFELDGQDTLFVAVDLAYEFSQKGTIHILNQQVTIMGYKYIRADHDTVYNIKDGVNRLGTAIVYDQTEPQTIPIDHLYIKNTTKSNAITASSKRNTKIATFDMQGYLGARPGNITFQIGSDTSTPNLKNSIYFVNTKTGDRAKVSNVGSFYTFDFGEVRHNWDTMQTYALYINKPKASSKPKTYPVSYLGVQEANNMDNYGLDVMFLKLTIKK